MNSLLSMESNLDLKSLVPTKLLKKYEVAYNNFVCWKERNDIEDANNTEMILLGYFHNLSQENKSSSTLWSTYSMLRQMLLVHHNTDIKKYFELNSFLKQSHEGYKPKKSNVLKNDDINRFLQEAPDDIYFLDKIIIIVAVSGSLRCEEVAKVKITDIVEEEGMLLVIIPNDKKNHKPRSFLIATKFIPLINKYIKLRPECDHDRFFVHNMGKNYSRQPVGINRISAVPNRIATFLKLDNPSSYTGHCFRLSGSSLCVEDGMNKDKLRQLSEWKSVKSKKYSRQPVGIDRISAVPNIIATFLKLDNSSSYTGHYFRRSGTSYVEDGINKGKLRQLEQLNVESRKALPEKTSNVVYIQSNPIQSEKSNNLKKPACLDCDTPKFDEDLMISEELIIVEVKNEYNTTENFQSAVQE